MEEKVETLFRDKTGKLNKESTDSLSIGAIVFAVCVIIGVVAGILFCLLLGGFLSGLSKGLIHGIIAGLIIGPLVSLISFAFLKFFEDK